MKENFGPVIQKVLATILACLLLVCLIPVGPHTDTEDTYNGEFIRVLPSYEKYSDGSNSKLKKIGLGYGAYYTFSLNQLLDIDINEIKSATFRLSFAKGNGTTDNKIDVAFSNDEFFSSITNPSESFITTIRPQTLGADDSLSEIDLTDSIKSLLSKGSNEISFSLKSNASIPVLLASTSIDDPYYRPCLKIVTGQATDEFVHSLSRTELLEATYVSRDKAHYTGNDLSHSGILSVGNGDEIYLRFNLDNSSIWGAPYKSVLSLNKLDLSDAPLKISCINNDQWTENDISYNNRPRGEENIVYSAYLTSTTSDGKISFDVTQAICQALKLGMTSPTFRITCDDGQTSFSGAANSRLAPKLYVKASDDKNLVAIAEASVSALSDNSSRFVTSPLLDSFTASNGINATIQWEEFDNNGTNLNNKHISSEGRLTRPKWFEGNKEVVAYANIQSGRKTSKRGFSLTIPAEAAPDYSKYKFSNYINIGDAHSEQSQKFEYVNLSGTKIKLVDTKIFTYRSLYKDSVAVLNLSCIKTGINYLTLKLWAKDLVGSNPLKLTLYGKNATYNLPTPIVDPSGDDSFIYATYALPLMFTEGRTNITLGLSYLNPQSDDYTPIGLYSAYLTQSPAFEPKQFIKQGEKPASRPFFSDNPIKAFLTRFIGENTTDNILSINEADNSVVIANDNTNIVFFLNDTATIYQSLDNYDRYVYACPIEYVDDLYIVNYGAYTLVKNNSENTASFPVEKAVPGIYRELVSGNYYSFSTDGQPAAGNTISSDTEILDGGELKIEGNSVVLLSHIAEPTANSNWIVSRINDRGVSEISFNDREQISSITVKNIGGINSDALNLTLLCAIYDNSVLINMTEKVIPIYESISTYSIDLSQNNIFMERGLSMRIFVYDSTEKLTNISPKIELP